jgi:threonine dehydratase
MSITPDDVLAAARRLAGHTLRTPLLENIELNQRVGGRVLIKAENLQRTGSFKFRGAYNRLSQLSADERRRGVIAWSSGNHAQGVAAAAAILDVPATIVMPADAPAIKAENTRRLGARIVSYDRFSENREAIARCMAEETGAIIVPSYDDPDIIAGQGTVGLEMLEQSRTLDSELDQCLVCCGGGGLIGGIAMAFEDSPRTALYSVEPEAFDDTARSLRSGQRERNADDARSICDALLSPTPGELTFPINRARLSGGLTVSDEAVRDAMRFAFQHLKLVVEPGGAVALAAVLQAALPLAGRCTAIVISGGNVDPAFYAAVIDG